MSRRKKHEEHENHERWLVSYADFITLLFAFFTVLYATSHTDAAKLEAVIDGLNAAFNGGMPRAVYDFLGFETEDSQTAPSFIRQEAATQDFTRPEISMQGGGSENVLQLGLVDQDLTLVLPERLFFAPGSAELHPSSFAVLAEIASSLVEADAEVQVIGHADGVPVAAGSPFRDNWGLASARGAATVRYLQSKGVSDRKLTASGRIVPGERPEARAVTLEIHCDDPHSAAALVEELWADTTRR